MKRKLISTVLLGVLLLSIGYVSKAQTQFLYGNIINKGLTSGISQCLQLKVADTNGTETVYTCNRTVKFNGKNYRDAETLYSEIEEGSFVKMAIEDNVVTVINASGNCVSYKNVSYDEKDRMFEGLRKRKTGVPVYYKYNGAFVPLKPDKNHLYDIDVYDYAICVTDIQSKNDSVIIEYIDISNDINGSFNQNIYIYCETEASASFVLKGDLYDEKKNLIFSEETEGVKEFELNFSQIENENKSYIYEIWMEDSEGRRVSSVYTGKYDLKAAQIVNSYLAEKGITSGLNEEFQLRAYDETGKEIIYDFNEKRVIINGERYRNIDDINAAISVDSFAKIALVNGEVSVISFSNAYETSEEVLMHEITDRELPVYYKYDGSFVPAYLDENHEYSIEVYDYAVLITDMRAMGKEKTIKYIDIGNTVNKNFEQVISIYCIADLNEDCIIKGELYKDGKLIDEARSEGNSEFDIEFSGLENKTEAYDIKFWLENSEGNSISPVYSMETTVEECAIEYVFIAQKGITSGIQEEFQLKAYDKNGVAKIYDFNEKKTIVNGERYREIEELDGAIRVDSFAKIALKDGVATVVSYDDTPEVNHSVSDADIKSKNLPVFYMYNDSFVPVYLDENHNYDIEIYDYAVCITDMVSKNMPTTIKYIQVSDGINRNFTKFICVECETDSLEELTLKSEVYTGKAKHFRKSEVRGIKYFSLDFDTMKNNTQEYSIKLWLENSENIRVSNVYTINMGTKKNEIIYGDVILKHTRTTDDKEEEVLVVKDINGKERLFVCDENVEVVDNASVFLLNSEETEIPENTFVKFAVENDVIKVIQLESDTVEVATDSFKSENDILEGTVCIINNSQEKVYASCVAAVYDLNNKLKSITEIPLEIDANNDKTIYPHFEECDLQEGDYIKIFSLSKGEINPIFNSLYEEIK